MRILQQDEEYQSAGSWEQYVYNNVHKTTDSNGKEQIEISQNFQNNLYQAIQLYKEESDSQKPYTYFKTFATSDTLPAKFSNKQSTIIFSQ